MRSIGSILRSPQHPALSTQHTALSPQHSPPLTAAADLAPLLVLPHLEELLPRQRDLPGVREFLMRDIAFIGVVAGDLTQVVPQMLRQLPEIFVDHAGFRCKQWTYPGRDALV